MLVITSQKHTNQHLVGIGGLLAITFPELTKLVHAGLGDEKFVISSNRGLTGLEVSVIQVRNERNVSNNESGISEYSDVSGMKNYVEIYGLEC
mgnify:FL=1